MSKIDQLLKFDPLAAAEDITGVSYKDKKHGEGLDNSATMLGLVLAQRHALEKERVLRDSEDTILNNELPRYQHIIEKYGFEQVLADKWLSKWRYNETYFVYAHKKGLLLAFDTFNGKAVNSGKVYYNWRPHIDNPWRATSSGGFSRRDEAVWLGDHDCREALIHNLNKLNNCGEFVCPWVERPWLWLLHYDEPKEAGYDHAAITEARIARLPDWVRAFIDPVTPKQSQAA